MKHFPYLTYWGIIHAHCRASEPSRHPVVSVNKKIKTMKNKVSVAANKVFSLSSGSSLYDEATAQFGKHPHCKSSLFCQLRFMTDCSRKGQRWKWVAEDKENVHMWCLEMVLFSNSQWRHPLFGCCQLPHSICWAFTELFITLHVIINVLTNAVFYIAALLTLTVSMARA